MFKLARSGAPCEEERMRKITVGITGASGSIYAQRLLAHLDECPDVMAIDLVVSQAGIRVVREELGINVSGTGT